jgi:hypothetical protein
MIMGLQNAEHSKTRATDLARDWAVSFLITAGAHQCTFLIGFTWRRSLPTRAWPTNLSRSQAVTMFG